MRRVGLLRYTMTVVVLAALAMLCLSDLVAAAMPEGGSAACVDLLCDRQSGCGVTTAKAIALPVATPAAEPTIAVSLAVTTSSPPVEIPAAVSRQVVPLPPRSPPHV